ASEPSDVSTTPRRLESSEQSLNVVHVVVQNWILFQRDSFDFIDETGAPFVSQIFLIERSTGRYIHRAQGIQVEDGASQDLDVLVSKLVEVFHDDVRVCQGYPIQDLDRSSAKMTCVDYPYQRCIAISCQILFPSLSFKNDLNERIICTKCQEVWHSINVKEKGRDSEEVKKEAIYEGDDHFQLFPSIMDTTNQDNESEMSEFSYESEDDSNNTRSSSTKAHSRVKQSSLHSRRLYHCNHCTKVFTSSAGYNKHLRYKRHMKCHECQQKVATFVDLMKHVSKKHPKMVSRYRPYVQDEDITDTMKVPRKCLLCDMFFNGNVLLHRHKDTYHELGDYRCSECHEEPFLTYYDQVIHNYQVHSKASKFIPPHTLGIEEITHRDGKIETKRTLFVCQLCQAPFNSDVPWTGHMRNKHSWGLFECRPCDEVCHYAKDISAHMLNFHADCPEIKCPCCSEVLNLTEDHEIFNTHYQGCPHEYVKKERHCSFQCDYCGKNYSSKGSFAAHIKQHQGIERFKCSHCDYGTNIKAVLIDHERMHLRDKGLTNADSDLVLYHQCEQCGKEFSQKQTLRIHIKRVHQGISVSHPCKDCGKTMASQSSLYKHKRKFHGFVKVWSNESYWDSLAMNSRKLKAVLEEETELFPPLEEEEHRTEDLVSDFKPNLKSDDDQVNRPLRIQLARQISRKRPVHNEVPPEDDPTKRVYSCNHCAQTFSSPDAYQKHQRKKRKVGCKECKKDIFTFKQLIEHASKAHPKTIEKYLKYGQNSADLKLLKVPKKCSLCDLVLNGNFLLYRHKEIYHELGDFKCATCQEPCLTYYDLVIHNYQEHDQSLKHIQPQTYGLEAVTFPDGKVEYKRVNFACEHCDATYCNDSGWTMHMIANHSWDLFKCKLWEETCHYAHDFSTHVLNFHPYNPEVKCPTPYCFHVSNLKEDPDHFNLHFQECRRPRYDCKSAPQQGMFQCDTCGKKYSSKGSFDAHIKQHQGIERYKCIHCDYGTNIKVVLIDHENKHLREKGLTNADTNLVLYHQCDQCGKEFAHKHSLRNHIKSTHLSIQKIRECKDCGQRFRSQSVLYLHKRRVHGFVNTKPIRGGRRLRWICSVCQASGNHRDEMIDIPDSDCLMENPVKLEAVLDEDTELFPTQDDECSAEPEADFEFDFEYDEDDDDEKDNISPGTRLARKRKSLQAHTEETIEDKPARKTYSCNHCSETFFTGDAYHRHQRKKRKVGCKECNKDIVTFKQLIEHASKAHPDDAERYIKYGQNPVELQSVKVPKKCSLCDMIFNGNLLLYRHRDVFHELGDYKCATCQVPCLTYYDLVIHNYQKHDQALEHPQPQTFGLEAVSLPDGKVEYKRTSFACQHCSATYTNDSAWTMHMRANHSWDLFECKACDEACHYAADFSAHMVHFHPDKPEIKCPTQGCAYVSDLSQDPDHFNTHYKECRTPRNNYKNFPEKNLFQCDTCGKKYFSKTSFECHIKQHQGIERYKCSHCDYGTNTKTVLIDHEKSHLRDKGLTNADTNLVLYHRCDQCGKEFSQKQSLRDHIKSIHLGIKKLRECKDCGQIFKSQSVLYIHKRKMHGFVNTQPLNRGGRKKKKIEPEQK
ncbi:hypothetical protein TCAL_12062, partial [Tigriopus californicus]